MYDSMEMQNLFDIKFDGFVSTELCDNEVQFVHQELLYLF